MTARSTRRRLEYVDPRNGAVADMEVGRAIEADPAPARVVLTPVQHERFHALYREHFDFVFRNLRRLGVPGEAVEDALQEVFVVALRRMDDYREGSSGRAWLFAIALRVAGNFRRSLRRRGEATVLHDALVESPSPSPFELTARGEAGRMLHEFLDRLGDSSRAMFVMSELEHMTAPEIASALSMNVNTVYTRLQVARADFGRAAAAFARGSGVFRRMGNRHA